MQTYTAVPLLSGGVTQPSDEEMRRAEHGAIVFRLDKIIELLEILTSPIEDEEEEPERYLDGTPM